MRIAVVAISFLIIGVVALMFVINFPGYTKYVHSGRKLRCKTNRICSIKQYLLQKKSKRL